MKEDTGTTFSTRVYRVVAMIPHGKVTTYGAIARALGSPRSARMVGFALKVAPERLELPAQRVLNRYGFLSGGWHFGHPDIMRAELEDEGVVVSDDYIVDLNVYFWDPASEPEVDELLRANY
jgi:methylated-DNA-protein-cysteine methyltransferase-like protein